MLRRILIAGAALLAAAVTATILIAVLGADRYRIPSEAMKPTLDVGDTIQSGDFGDEGPRIGDVVLLHPPAGAERARCGVSHPPSQVCPRPVGRLSGITFIKRVVAGPGDRITVVDGQVVRDGEPADEPFIAPCAPGGGCNFPQPATVPPDHYFVMGDNRGASADSRFWGPVPRDAIIGRAERCDLYVLMCEPVR